MAALGTTNISTTLVGNTIGNSSRNVGVLCTANTINKWSRYKPVDYKINWGNNDFGLTYGNTTLANFNVYNYIYRDRLGDYSVNPNGGYRLGDFRGYNHDAVSPVYNASYQSADTYSNAAFFCPSLQTTSDILMSEFVDTLGGVWNGAGWYFGVRLTLPDGTKLYQVSSTDMLTYLVPGLYFDMTNNNPLVYNKPRGTVTYHTFITPTSGGLADTDTLTTTWANSSILLLPDGVGTFNWVAAPPAPADPVFASATVPVGFYLTGSVNYGDNYVTYVVDNETGASQNITLHLTVTDKDGVVLYPVTNAQITSGIGVNSARTMNIYHGGTADYDQTFTVSIEYT